MAEKIPITRRNAKQWSGVVSILTSELEHLALLTREYPVEFSFQGYSFVFESRSDIERLIAELRAQVDRALAA